MTFFSQLNAQNRAGKTQAIASVCSAQPDVLTAALYLAKELDRPVLIEATSNQVNQFGGYTGMKPADFIGFVKDLAAQCGTPSDLIHFGGDHLGPQVWRSEPAEAAMDKACDLLRAYVEAGFTKIHLDCSEGCAGEPAQVDDETSAARAARLAAVCEKYAPDPGALSYVIGTEVPPPGGARADEEGQGIAPTEPERARHTLDCHLASFKAAGIEDAWQRIVGLVVQPGLEFAPTHVDHFDRNSPNRLSLALQDEPHICFEAHSTDYQCDTVYPELALRNFSVLKVGPALTFAYRQALYGLDQLASLLDPDPERQSLIATMEGLMSEKPEYWQKHYVGSERELFIQRHFGYADRIRYYWPEPAALKAVQDLLGRLPDRRPADPVLQQYFAPDVIDRAKTLEGGDIKWPRALVIAQVQHALRPYYF